MKYLPLLLANLRRKKIRTGLTIGSFAVALFLFGVLAAISTGFRAGHRRRGRRPPGRDRPHGVIQPLPLPYQERIRRLPGREAKSPTRPGSAASTRTRRTSSRSSWSSRTDWRGMYPEFAVPDGRVAGVRRRPPGCRRWARKLAQRFGWKLGDHVPLKAPGYLGGSSWDFNVRGIYRGTRPQDDEAQFWLQHDYLYEKAPALLAGPRRLVRRARREPGRGAARREGDRRRSSRTRPPRRARRPSRRSPPRS